jgi:hypothetical protein
LFTSIDNYNYFRFTKLGEGDMPFGIKEIEIPEQNPIDSYKAAKHLLKFDQDLYADSNRNSSKKKRNDSKIKHSETFDNIEELIVPEEIQYASLMCSSNKKQKLFNNQSEEVNEKCEDIKSIKQSNKIHLSKKKKSKRLNVSESNTNRKYKKPIKTCSYIEEYKTTEADNVSANTGSTSCNWNVDIPTLSSVIPTTSDKVLEKKEVTKKETFPKNIDSKVINSSTPWLTPVLVRLEEQNKVSEPTDINIILKP